MSESVSKAAGVRRLFVYIPDFCIDEFRIAITLGDIRDFWSPDTIEKRSNEREEAFYRRLHGSRDAS